MIARQGPPPILSLAGLLLTVCFPSAGAGQQGSGASVRLDDAVSLDRTGRAGDSMTYRISRENLALAPDGSVLSVIDASGVLVRTLTEEVEEGVWSETVTWREYTYGEHTPGTSDADPSPIAGAEGVRYAIDPNDLYHAWFTVPAHRMTPGPAATLFSVLVLDAWSWDGLLHELRRAGHRRVRPGERYALEGWSGSRDLGSPTTGLEGRYRLGALEVSVVGISACGASDLCVRIAFRADGNEVAQEVTGVRIAGREYLVGTADFSVEDGALVTGEIWGPLIATFMMNDASLPISGVLQRVWISRL